MTSPELANAHAAIEPIHTGMRTIDISGNARVAILMETMGAVSRATDPEEVIDLFSRGMDRLNGPRGLMAINTRGLAPAQYRIAGLTHDDGEQAIRPRTAWMDAGDAPAHEGGFFGQLIRTAYPELIHNFHLHDDPVLGDVLARYGSMMAIPIFDGGEPTTWAVLLHREQDGFDAKDMEEAILRTNVIGRAARNVQIAGELRRAHRLIQGEIEQIATIQRALLPARLPDVPGLRIDASYQVFDQAGGDMYDFVPIARCPKSGTAEAGSAWMFVIADASGHGPAAAVVAAMVHAILHAYPNQPCGSADILRHVNRHLAAKRIESTFVTAFLGIYEPTTRTLTYSRAGHDPPLLKSRDGSVRRLDDIGGIPLGIMGDVAYEQQSLALEPGQTLVMYTDGITEARSPAGEMFSVAGMERALALCSGEAECVVRSITDALAVHEAGVRPRDDQTLVAIQAV